MHQLAIAAMNFPDWSPALIEINLESVGLGSFPLRWYALGYIAGLLVAWRYAIMLSDRPALWGGTAPLSRTGVEDLIFYVTLGIILGGRLGYVAFYQLPHQWDETMRDPWQLVRIWEGGMSFHGGLIGVCLAVFGISRQHQVNVLSLGDIGGLTAGFGIFFVRLANFMNAELFGRHTDSSAGMIFPEGWAGGTPSAYDWQSGTWVYTGAELPRYPSQLYEAVLEGLIPVIVTSILVWRFKALERPGLIAGLFLLLYGFGRSIAERFREPDPFVQGLPEWLTMGQMLSAPMWIAGAYLVWRALQTAPASGQKS